jgi:hypothetical protein
VKKFFTKFNQNKVKQIDKEISYNENPSMLGDKCWGDDDISDNKKLRIKEQTTQCDFGPSFNEGDLEAEEDDFDWGEE